MCDASVCIIITHIGYRYIILTISRKGEFGISWATDVGEASEAKPNTNKKAFFIDNRIHGRVDRDKIIVYGGFRKKGASSNIF